MANKRPQPSRVRVRPGGGPPPSVDGHPGWVEADSAAWGFLAALLICASGLLSGTGPILTQARSAAWWVTLLGTTLGALLIWLPLWRIMHGQDGKALSYDEALRAAFGEPVGKILSLLTAVAALLDTALLLRCLCGIVPLYLIEGASEVAVAFAAVAALGLILCRHGGRGFSRCAWALRFLLFGLLAVSGVLMLENANVYNLVPVFGESANATLAVFPIALGNGAGVMLLGLLPRFTGSARPPCLRRGVVPAILGGILCGVLTLLTNLSIPPHSIRDTIPGGIRLMLAIEYLRRSQLYRMFYHYALLMLFLLSAGAAMAGCGGMLAGAWRNRFQWRHALAAALLCAAIALCPDGQFFQTLWQLRLYRAALLIVPPWAAFALRGIRGAKGRG